MPNPTESQLTSESGESFTELLAQYEKSHSRKAEDGTRQIEGTVIAITADSVLLDIGFKSEGVLPLAMFQSAGQAVKPGDKMPVTVKGRDAEGYYMLARGKIAQPADWASLEKAFAEKTTIAGTVSGVVKGGFSVDVGVRAFMPASRSGTRDAAEMEKLVGQEIRCRIIKLDSTEEDIVVDRRAVAEKEELAVKQRRYSELQEGDIVQGSVRSLTDYGAFIDIGGIDALLHISDISWSRINKPEDLLSLGQQIEAKVLKIDSDKKRISVGLKQLQPHPWDLIQDKYKVGERARGTVTRLMEFGAFVELDPGIEGLIHISEMSWAKKVRSAGEVVKPGDTVEAVILGVNPVERRISLGLKQALGDPWADIAQKLWVGSAVEGPVTSLTKFGAFVQLSEGVEGMIHISDMSAEKRLNHPQDMLKTGQLVKAQVLEIDTEKRRIKLGIKQLVPTSLEEYIAEHQVGDLVTGRVVEASEQGARVEVGEGIQGTCVIHANNRAKGSSDQEKPSTGKADLSSLGSMLQARWKSGAAVSEAKPEPLHAGQIRKFKITRLDGTARRIELELA
jgi:small subunit ribosomal protein S1